LTSVLVGKEHDETEKGIVMRPKRRYRRLMVSLLAVVAFAFTAALASSRDASSPAAAAPKFTLFESGQVRPLAMSPDRRHLFAVNTPDNRLEVFRIREQGLVHTASIPVGLEPVAVAARSDREVWVVNHLSALYVAALGSDKVGVFSTAELEADTFVPNAASHIPVSGGGPTGLVLDEARRQLYVLTRFDDGISIVDTRRGAEAAHLTMHNPEPPSVVAGRRFLYDARFSSSHGDSSCASCHVFGDFDSLAWDLGNPDGQVIANPGPFNSLLLNVVTGQPMDPIFHPMKGPMATQSLRGMANHGPMHWRGDRTGGNDAPSAQPNGGTFDERAAFAKFNPAFVDLLGRHAPLAPKDMAAFTDFILQITYPPNPNRRIDNVLTADQEAGRKLFDTVNCGIPSAPDFNGAVLTCASCHKIDPNANPGTAAPGLFGSNGRSSFDFNPQLFKVPHLRNLYQKVGKFGSPENPGFLGGDNGFKGDQVRGYGFLNDGSLDTVFRFVHGISFSEQFNGPGKNGIADGPAGEVQRQQLEAFVLAFPTNLAPVMGQQVTLTAASAAAVGSRVGILRQRADAGECDLVAKTTIAGEEAGFLYVGSGLFKSDRRGQPPIPAAELRSLTGSGHPVTYTCVPRGSGERLGVDRDGDGVWDGDERDAHTDPADPRSRP